MIDKEFLTKMILRSEISPEIKGEIEHILKASKGKKLTGEEEEQIRVLLQFEARLQFAKAQFWGGFCENFDRLVRELKFLHLSRSRRLFEESEERVGELFSQHREKIDSYDPAKDKRLKKVISSSPAG